MKKEFSAGGIIFKNNKILMILMKTITGKKVWTFPKGHIETGEDSHKAAIREVFEETGIKCEIKNKNEFFISHYFFYRNGEKIEKKVYWYMMDPIEDIGLIQTPEEIEQTKWFDLTKDINIIEYESDKKMIAKLKKRIGGQNGI